MVEVGAAPPVATLVVEQQHGDQSGSEELGQVRYGQLECESMVESRAKAINV